MITCTQKIWETFITLFNVVYKLPSGCIAERIKVHLDKLINRDQTGFI